MAHRFVFINSEGLLNGICSPGSDDQFVNLQMYGDSRAVIIPAEVDSDDLMVTGWYDTDDDTWKIRDKCPSLYHVWVDKAWAFDSESFFEILRSERNEKLYSSDWTQLVDSPLPDSDKALWVTYRAALRDVPSTNASITSLDDVVWPAEPGE